MFNRIHIGILLVLSLLFVGCDIELTGDEVEDNTHEQENNEVEGVTEKEQDETSQSFNELTVHYIDAGQGDATLFQYSDENDDYTILYDVGDWKRNDVINYLNQNKINEIDLVIISHPHADHMGQLEQLIETTPVGEVWMTGNSANTNVFQRAAEAVLNSDADYYEPQVGEVFDIGNMELTILHPDDLTGKLNEDSLSIHFTYGEVSFLFTGDAYKNEELMMLKREDNIQADFLQLGHHGSSTSSDPAFIEAVSPTYSIYSAGIDNQYGHPHLETVNYFNENNLILLGTDIHGTIIVSTNGATYDVTTEKEGDVKAKKSVPHEKAKPTEDISRTKDNTKGCIDINEASSDQLKQIMHIGDERAESLISHRPYDSVNQLTRIHGIGKGRIKDIIEQDIACAK